MSDHDDEETPTERPQVPPPQRRPPLSCACCGEARVVEPRSCICRMQTDCPTHGRRCHGSHE